MDYDCNIPKNIEIDLSEAFPGSVTNPACTNLAESLSEGGDQVIFDNEVLSYIQERGYPVLYYPYAYDINKAETVYGEHSAAGYLYPFKTYIMLTIQDSAPWINIEGFTTDETVTGWIHIKDWKRTVKQLLESENSNNCLYNKLYNINYIEENDIIHAIEPKVKDLIQLTTFGCDREFNRGNKIYEIVSKDDEIFSDNNLIAGGHYVWKITAKRYHYSYEDGLSIYDKNGATNPYIGILGEKGNSVISETKSVYKMFLEADGITDEKAESLLVGETGSPIYINGGIRETKIEFEKNYNQDIVEDSKNNFNMETRNENVYKDNGSTILSNDLF